MILITDATRFVGRAMTRHLVSTDRAVCCLLQPSKKEQRLPTGIRCNTVAASMNNLPALRTSLQDVSAVVHSIAGDDLDQDEGGSNHLASTTTLVEAMRDAEGTELATELAGRLDAIDGIVSTLEESSPAAAVAGGQQGKLRLPDFSIFLWDCREAVNLVEKHANDKREMLDAILNVIERFANSKAIERQKKTNLGIATYMSLVRATEISEF